MAAPAQGDRPSRRRWLAGPLTGLVATALVLAAGELAVRVLGIGPIAWGPTARLIAPDGRLILDLYPSDPRGYFDLDLRDPPTRARYAPLGLQAFGLPDFDTVAARAPHGVELRFNSHGFRDREWAPRRAGVRRVAVLGDSFTEGQGVRAQDVYPRVLGERLEAAQPGRWEVANFGKRAADFPALEQSFGRLLEWEPDIVVYGMVLNDAEQSESFRRRQRHLNDWILERRRMISPGEALTPGGRSLLLATLRDRLEAWRVGRESTRWYREMYGPENGEGWARTQAALRRMNRRMRERGGYLLLASWPLLVSLDHYPFADTHARIGRFCIEAGIAWHDLVPALRARPTPELWVHGGDRHPNERAHRLAAEDLAGAVLALAEQL